MIHLSHHQIHYSANLLKARKWCFYLVMHLCESSKQGGYIWSQQKPPGACSSSIVQKQKFSCFVSSTPVIFVWVSHLFGSQVMSLVYSVLPQIHLRTGQNMKEIIHLQLPYQKEFLGVPHLYVLFSRSLTVSGLRYHPLLSRSLMRDGWCIQLIYQSS